MQRLDLFLLEKAEVLVYGILPHIGQRSAQKLFGRADGKWLIYRRNVKEAPALAADTPGVVVTNAWFAHGHRSYTSLRCPTLMISITSSAAKILKMMR